LDRRSATRVTRTHRLAAIAALACAATFAMAGPARAAVTIGQLPSTAPSASCPSTSTDYLEPSVTSGNLYVAKEAGMITSWSTMSAGAGASYVLKIFRRTPDPDVYQVMAHSPPRTLSSGLNTVVVSLPVSSGDMIGLNAGGNPPFPNSCTFPWTGDTVLNRTGSVQDGQSGTFSPLGDVRLNLSAVLVPSNDFTISISRDRRSGKATITASTSNPGVVSLASKGLKSGRAAKSVFVAGPVSFTVASTGKWRRKLNRTGRVAIGLVTTFAPVGGDPSSQSLTLRLRKRPTPVSL
jgi:hypothetical protein